MASMAASISADSGVSVAGRVSCSCASDEAPMMVLATNQRERTKPECQLCRRQAILRASSA
jgi:hypothetical protein